MRLILAIWERAHRNVSKAEAPKKNNLEGDWTNLRSATFKASQSDFFSTTGASYQQVQGFQLVRVAPPDTPYQLMGSHDALPKLVQEENSSFNEERLSSSDNSADTEASTLWPPLFKRLQYFPVCVKTKAWL